MIMPSVEFYWARQFLSIAMKWPGRWLNFSVIKLKLIICLFKGAFKEVDSSQIGQTSWQFSISFCGLWLLFFYLFVHFLSITLWRYYNQHDVTNIFSSVFSFYISSKKKDEGIRSENFLWSLIVTMCFSIGIYGHYEPKKGYLRVYVGCVLLYGMHFAIGTISSRIFRRNQLIVMSFQLTTAFCWAFWRLHDLHFRFLYFKKQDNKLNDQHFNSRSLTLKMPLMQNILFKVAKISNFIFSTPVGSTTKCGMVTNLAMIWTHVCSRLKTIRNWRLR